jgi:hypothetical protein
MAVGRGMTETRLQRSLGESGEPDVPSWSGSRLGAHGHPHRHHERDEAGGHHQGLGPPARGGSESRRLGGLLRFGMLDAVLPQHFELQEVGDFTLAARTIREVIAERLGPLGRKLPVHEQLDINTEAGHQWPPGGR